MSQKPQKSGLKLFDTSKRARTNPEHAVSSSTGERSTSQRVDHVLAGAILVTEFTSAVAGASDLLGPLKVASDILKFVLKSAQVSIALHILKDYFS